MRQVPSSFSSASSVGRGGWKRQCQSIRWLNLKCLLLDCSLIKRIFCVCSLHKRIQELYGRASCCLSLFHLNLWVLNESEKRLQTDVGLFEVKWLWKRNIHIFKFHKIIKWSQSCGIHEEKQLSFCYYVQIWIKKLFCFPKPYVLFDLHSCCCKPMPFSFVCFRYNVS